MARPLSEDIRERVIAAVAAGASTRAGAARFGVAVSSVVKWSQRYRATGSVAPGKMGGHRKRVLEPHRAFIMERLGQTPHLTLHGLKAELAGRGVKVVGAQSVAKRLTGTRIRCSPRRRARYWHPLGSSAVGTLAPRRSDRPP